jgi:hypothetical protein
VQNAEQSRLHDQQRCTAARAGKPSNIPKPAQCRAKTDASVVLDTAVLAAGNHDSGSRKSALLIKP